MTLGYNAPVQLFLPDNIAAVIGHHVASGYPDEACGILLGQRVSGGVLIAAALQACNVAPPADRPSRYEIDPLALLHAQRQADSGGLLVAGFFHSHPDQPPVPSRTDAAAAWPDYVYLIVPTTAAGAGVPRAWQLTSGGAMTGGISGAFAEIKIASSPANPSASL